MAFECRVYWARPGDARPEHRRWFTEAECGRADAYRREIDRARFIVGCALSRAVLGELLSMAPGEVPLLRDCDDCGQPHGRPRLPGDAAFVSVSHSGEHVVVAVTRAGDVGVDVEQHRPESLDLAEAVLTETERADLARLPKAERVAGFFGYWTRKEAVLKATGHGLRVPMTSVEVSAPDVPATVRFKDGVPGLRLTDLDAGAGHSAALAVVAESMPRVVRPPAAHLLSIH